MAPARITSLALFLVSACILGAADPPTLAGPHRVILPGTVHPRLASLVPLGAVPASTPLEHMNLVLKMDAGTKARLEAHLRRLQDRTSPDFHKWLSPEEFRQNYGPSQDKVDAAVRWLMEQGLTVQGVARGGMSIAFSGTASQVGLAFRTSIQEFELNGARRRGNTTPISLPETLAGFVAGVSTLHDVPRMAYHHILGRRRPQVTDSSGDNFLSPGDLATIYGMNTLYGQGITGSGVTIGVVGRTDIPSGDLGKFAGTFGVNRTGTYVQVNNGPDPGTMDPDEQFEAEADTQWSGSIAPGANILFVISPSSIAADGTDLSAQYLVDNNAADIITCSFGSCEAQMNSSELVFYQNLWAQAAAEGISVFVATGDDGSAGCDDPDDFSGTKRGVSGLASTPNNTAVGGTMFNEGTASYWGAYSSTDPQAATALGYIPEAAWNESGTVTGGSRLWAGSGGVSAVYTKPSWQVAPNVPTDGMRDIPDVSLDAAGVHDPFLVYIGGADAGFYEGGGTSLAAPSMAGIMALIVQKYGRQGNPNPILYSLGNAQYSSGSAPAVFHDVTTGNNSVPGVTGWGATLGYDLATGLGSVNAPILFNNWSGANPITITSATASASSAKAGTNITFSGTATESTQGAILTYTWYFSDVPPSTTGGSSVGLSGQQVVHAFTATAGLPQTYPQTFIATLVVSDGYSYQAANVPVTITPTGVIPTITAPVTGVWVVPGTTVNFNASAQTFTGATGAFTYSWDFGDGGTANSASASHAYAANDGAFYTATVTATDSNRVVGTASVQVYSSLWCLDQNGDGVVDVRDLLALSAGYGTAATSQSNLSGLSVFGDINADGKVDINDINLWISNFTPGMIP